jgi:hypothetical protein
MIAVVIYLAITIDRSVTGKLRVKVSVFLLFSENENKELATTITMHPVTI